MSEDRIRKLVARREIPYCQEAPGCRIFFSRADLDESLASFRHPAAGGANVRSVGR